MGSPRVGRRLLQAHGVGYGAVDAPRVAMEKPFLVGVRQVGDDAFETAIDVVERAAQTVHREVAGEHRPLDAEQGDAFADDPGVVLDAPAPAGLADAGDLQRHVGAFGEARHGPLPGGQPLLAAIGRQAGVVEHDQRIGEVARQACGLGEVPPGCLQVEVQAVPGQLGIAATPALVAHQAAQLADLLRALRTAGLVADAADPCEARLRLQHLGGVRRVQPGLRHHCVGRAMAFGEVMHEAGFAERIARVPLGFHVDRLDHPVCADVAEVVRRQVAALDRAVVAVAERNLGVLREPGVVVRLRVPEMMMGVDDRPVVQLSHALPRSCPGKSAGCRR